MCMTYEEYKKQEKEAQVQRNRRLAEVTKERWKRDREEEEKDKIARQNNPDYEVIDVTPPRHRAIPFEQQQEIEEEEDDDDI